MISKTPSLFSRSSIRPSTSRLVGSPQCTSSKIISTGPAPASASNCAVSALQQRGGQPRLADGRCLYVVVSRSTASGYAVQRRGVLSDHQPIERAAGFTHDDNTHAKLDKLDALLAKSLTPPQDAALLADMLNRVESIKALGVAILTPVGRARQSNRGDVVVPQGVNIGLALDQHHIPRGQSIGDAV